MDQPTTILTSTVDTKTQKKQTHVYAVSGTHIQHPLAQCIQFFKKPMQQSPFPWFWKNNFVASPNEKKSPTAKQYPLIWLVLARKTNRIISLPSYTIMFLHWLSDVEYVKQSVFKHSKCASTYSVTTITFETRTRWTISGRKNPSGSIDHKMDIIQFCIFWFENHPGVHSRYLRCIRIQFTNSAAYRFAYNCEILQAVYKFIKGRLPYWKILKITAIVYSINSVF